jgi:hypothetical protein
MNFSTDSCIKQLMVSICQGRNGGFPGFRIPWESHGNPGNLGNPMGILGIPQESLESSENPGNPMRILEIY